ncbi:hypothetical protein QCA50_015535 [Cerrena zonata]|uniref:C2H2-type domain-containing protein n=1 Tax=Cerrena zonata TaxID=2478898 RepID=A0AAW0FIB2_9APHY
MPPKRIEPGSRTKFYGSHQRLPCPYCPHEFRNLSGLSQHKNAYHRHTRTPVQYPPNPAGKTPHTPSNSLSPSPDVNVPNLTPPPTSAPAGIRVSMTCHPHLDGRPCDAEGNPLEMGTPPPPYTSAMPDDWTPYNSRLEFEMADFLFTKSQSSGREVNFLMDAFTAFGYPFGAAPPFADCADMHRTIDSTPLGDAPWCSFTAQYTGLIPEGEAPSWMTAKYDVWCRDPRTVLRNMLANPDFKDEINYAPYREYDKKGERQYDNLMLGNWAWRHADTIYAADPSTLGAMLIPIILGSDKTTVSVATGQNEYYPLYISLGNIFNNVRRAHRNAVAIIGFLAIPKSERKDQNSKLFRKFRRQLFHCSLSRILQPLRPGMTMPEVTRCPDGHFRRVIYDLGPYIADYPEQVLASCIVQGWCPLCSKRNDGLDASENIGHRSREHTEQLLKTFDLMTLWEDYGVVGDLIPFTNDFPRADIHELLSGDILHQVIKGTFKDHLVTWIGEYLILEHGEAKGMKIMDEIDRRIAAVPHFPGLRCFHQGWDFKQWTGDDSKALMKVYIPAIVGLVPDDMVQSLSTFMEACYIIRRSIHTDTTIKKLEDTLADFRRHREIFRTTGVRPDGVRANGKRINGLSLPRQHSLDHYPRHIREFGAPNGLCSSITESKHIKAVKEPWRRSNRFHALGQMLLTNQRLDKLAAARTDFEARGMLNGSLLSSIIMLATQPNEDSTPTTLVDQETTAPATCPTQAEAIPEEEEAAVSVVIR